MLINLLFLAYRSVHKIKSSSSIYRIGDFGFESNSTYSIKFTEVKTNNLYFCFLSELEINKYSTNQILLSHICHVDEKFPLLLYEIKNSKIPFYINGTIESAGVYYRVIANCENSDFLPPQTILSFTEEFQNPTSTLDSRWKGIKKFKTIIFLIFSFILMIWIILLLFKFSNISNLQILLTFVFISYLLVAIFRILEINQLENYDNDHGLTLARRIIAFIQKLLFYTTVLFICKGWCIIISHLSSELIYYFFVVFVFDIMLFLIDFEQLSSLYTTFLVISVFSACLVLQKIIVSLHEVRQYLLSKMISIINISDYKIVEINKIRNKYVILEISIISTSIIYMSFVVSTIFVTVPFFLYETINDCLLFAFLVVLMILFKDNQFDINSGYSSVSNMFSLTDLTPLEANNLIETPHETIEDEPSAVAVD